MGNRFTLELDDEQVRQLEAAARRMGRDPLSAAGLLLDEALRRTAFPSIEFRDSAAGRQTYLRGTRLAVWQIVRLVRAFGDEHSVAAHLEVPVDLVDAALDYARAFPTEIDEAFEDADAVAESLSAVVPGVEVVKVRAADL
jgi:uncharacterized protein (DUF433 family)